MIKINLKNRKAAVGVSASSSSGDGGAFGGMSGRLTDLIARVNSSGGGSDGFNDQASSKSMLTMVAVFAIILGATWWVSDSQKTRLLGEVATEAAAVDSKIAQLDSELSKTNGYEQIRKSLESDEKSIRTKINTIQELIHDRATPPKILMTLSEAIPKNVWLQNFILADNKYRISGGSDGMDVVSDFMRGLEETIYFKNVVLKSSKQDAQPKAGRTAAVFELEAEKR